MVKENTEEYFSIEDPLGEEVFQICFYLNDSNKSFKEKIIINTKDQEPLIEHKLKQQGMGQELTFQISYKKANKKVVITISPMDETVTKSKTSEQLKVNVKHLTVALAFQPDNSSSQLIINLSKLFLKTEK